jgi:hypothetical protein
VCTVLSLSTLPTAQNYDALRRSTTYTHAQIDTLICTLRYLGHSPTKTIIHTKFASHR